jgi:DNA topoisomerase-1
MAKTLVIVESPTKAKTIGRFLGKDYIVKSSYGHLRDLPKSKLGVDIEHNFEPEYAVPKDSKKLVTELKNDLKKSDSVILATDEDREGEAIAWHLIHALKLDNSKKDIKRITFHEITKSAIDKALEEPREVNGHLVDAQQARRVLDRLVGYKLSPFLWKKVMYGLSAGRVQSVAVRLIVERERERDAFKIEEYWTIEAEFTTDKNEVITAKLAKINKKSLDKFEFRNEKAVKKIIESFPKEWNISDVSTKKTTRKPQPPFTTSTLQQAANRRCGYSAKQTMRLAQQLYEGMDVGTGGEVGLITYMRTDSLNLSKDFIDASRAYIKNAHGEKYLPKKPAVFKAKSKLAQEAHEAVRPTHAELSPDKVKKYLDPKQFKLYELIWQRAVASQMEPAIMENASISIASKKEEFIFKSSGQIITFDGFLAVWPQAVEEKTLPKVSEKEPVTLKEPKPEQHFTEPPARYSDASLVKALEEHDIGRPSTYAPTIATIIDRGYVEKEERRLKPKDIAVLVTKLLEEHFEKIVDYEFTAKMENEFDKIAEGKTEWQPVIKKFYEPFERNLKMKEETLNKKDITEEKTEEKCPLCKKDLVIKMGRFGKFYACTGYPECKHTAQIGNGKEKKEPKKLDEKCPECNSALVERVGKFGPFIGCSNYPKCKYINNKASELGVKCPNCDDGEIVTKRTKRGKPFYGCNKYPKCETAFWTKPTGEQCPACKSLLTFAAKGKIKCSKSDCTFEKDGEEPKE